MHLAIVCKNRNCGEVFRLPYPTQEEKSEGPSQSSREIEHQAFWCWICGTVFPYTALDCRLEDVQKLAASQHRLGKAAYRIVFQCGQENCEAPVAVNTITDDVQSNVELTNLAARMNGKAVCERSHEFFVPAQIGDLQFGRIGADQICRIPSKS
jgi:hypothetical protein